MPHPRHSLPKNSLEKHKGGPPSKKPAGSTHKQAGTKKPTATFIIVTNFLSKTKKWFQEMGMMKLTAPRFSRIFGNFFIFAPLFKKKQVAKTVGQQATHWFSIPCALSAVNRPPSTVNR